MQDKEWIDLGPVQAFREGSLTEAAIGRTKIAVSLRDGRFGAVSGTCNHAGGPLGGPPGRRLHRLPLAQLEVPSRARARASRASRTTRCRATRSRSRTGGCWVNLEPATSAAQEAARTAPAGPAGSTRAPARSASRAFRPPRWTRRIRAIRPPRPCSKSPLRHARRTGCETS